MIDLFKVWLLINKKEKMSEEQIWLIVGFIGQIIFASRFYTLSSVREHQKV